MPTVPGHHELSENTIDQYKTLIKRLKNVDIYQHLVTDPDEIIRWIQTAGSPSGNIETQNNFISAILYEIKTVYPGSDATKYYDENKRLRATRNTKGKSQTLPPAKLENLVAWKDILDKKTDAQEKLSKIDYLLYLLYTEYPPLRADYCNLSLIESDEPTRTDNYIIKDTWTLVLNNYKTAKTFSRQYIPLTAPVVSAILDAYQPLPDTILVMSANNLTKKVRELMFKLTGKYMTISLLRHSYITEYLSVKRSLLEREALAKKMLHSSLLQECYVII